VARQRHGDWTLRHGMTFEGDGGARRADQEQLGQGLAVCHSRRNSDCDCLGASPTRPADYRFVRLNRSRDVDTGHIGERNQ